VAVFRLTRRLDGPAHVPNGRSRPCWPGALHRTSVLIGLMQLRADTPRIVLAKVPSQCDEQSRGSHE
jgi:hypothetical protein